MQYDAIILAGGLSSSELKKLAPYDNEALILIGQYPMIFYVYKALRKSPMIRNIVISGPVDALRNLFAKEEGLFFVDSGENAVESFLNAVNLLKDNSITEKLLVLPTDIPFITKDAIEDFISRCNREEGADFYYPVTSKEINETKFPRVSRTYVKLKEGVFTGGNLFLVRTAIIDNMVDIAIKLVERRKNPLAIAKLFGLNLVIKYIIGRLTIHAAEKRFYEVTKIKGKAIISPYAEIGVDVDKPSDLELAQKYLEDVHL
ncbi:MAG: NTP transferase domain-containing protein [Syntrophomonadaceae bacterium]|nr:NTP transferase domain-containing protein [Syntrophomonadaceae bacterium]